MSAHGVACSCFEPRFPRGLNRHCFDCPLHTPLPRMGWTGRAPTPDGSQSRGGLEARGDIVMSRKTDAVVARTIGIDTGKNTLNLIGLDDKGSDRFAREAHSRPDRGTACDSDQALRHIRENLVVSRRN